MIFIIFYTLKDEISISGYLEDDPQPASKWVFETLF